MEKHRTRKEIWNDLDRNKASDKIHQYDRRQREVIIELLMDIRGLKLLNRGGEEGGREEI